MNKNVLYLFLFVLAGCFEGEKESPVILFAGEIVNPTNDYVVLYKGETIIDSALLDKNNRFSFALDSTTNGLYHFNHTPEYQNVYLEKGDSLMVRLNTIDFDESLVFSGIGEELNNFLLELYLNNEKEERHLYSKYYPLEPREFHTKIEELRNVRIEEFKALQTEVQLSKDAKELVEASINYTYYTYKENYPFKHRKHSKKKTIKNLPNDFYTYRRDINFENKNFTYLLPYYNFMINHFGNLAYMSCSHKCAIKNNEVKNQLHYNRHKLELIDSLVKEIELKDNLFRNVAVDYLLKGHDKDENNSIFIKEFHNLSGNNRHIQEIDNLYQGIKNIQPNKEIPNIFVLNTDGKSVALREISKGKKTVFYFWSGTNKRHFRDISKQIAKLTIEKPKYSFVGINFNTDKASWKLLIKSSGLDQNNQYRTENFKKLRKTLIIYPLNTCIITEDTLIVDAFSSVYSSF
ncbi:MAG: transaldolase [Flavobacteriaceae bacterium]